MKIDVRRHGVYASVAIRDGYTTIDLGMLNDDERDELAQTLITAAYEAGPKFRDDRDPWFQSMLTNCGIDLTTQSQVRPAL